MRCRSNLFLLTAQGAFIAALLLGFHPASVVDAVEQSSEECSLQCLNMGECVWTWQSSPRSNHAFLKAMSCQCQDGFSGPLCEIDLDSDEDVVAADHSCTKSCDHGGVCVWEWSSTPHSTEQFRQVETCECPTGFSGENCEVADNMLDLGCTQHCHNGGSCVFQWQSAPNQNDAMVRTLGCECKPGFTGPTCEISLSDSEVDERCDLECQNGGECTFTWMETPPGMYFDSVFLSSFMVCECPSGFMGMHCEYQAESCEDGSICFGGGRCVQDGSSAKYSCDCTDAVNKEGSMCEQPQTEICHHRLDVGHERTLFCVNGGTCAAVQVGALTESTVAGDYHKCDCPRGFSGPHCEYLTTDAGEPISQVTESRSSSSTTSKRSAASVGIITLFAFAVVAALAHVAIRRFGSAKGSAPAPSRPGVGAGVVEADGSDMVERKTQLEDMTRDPAVTAHDAEIL